MRQLIRSSTAVIPLLLAAGAHAQTAPMTSDAPFFFPQSISQSVIGNAALSAARGRAAVNVAAGDSNAQSNAAAIAVGHSGGGSASAFVSVIQRVDVRTNGLPGVATAAIAEGAFANAAGMVSVNQTSGIGNAQANVVAIGLGFEAEAVADSRLAASVSGSVPAGGRPGGARVREASIADNAFGGARGLVQVNQSVGSGNSTANSFALRMETGARP